MIHNKIYFLFELDTRILHKINEYQGRNLRGAGGGVAGEVSLALFSKLK